MASRVGDRAGLPPSTGRPSRATSGWTSRVEEVRKPPRPVEQVSGRERGARPRRGSTCSRVMPARQPDSSGGVAASAASTRNTFAVVASHSSPCVLRSSASSAPARAGLGEERSRPRPARSVFTPGQRIVLVAPQARDDRGRGRRPGLSGRPRRARSAGPHRVRGRAGPAPLVTVIRMRASRVRSPRPPHARAARAPRGGRRDAHACGSRPPAGRDARRGRGPPAYQRRVSNTPSPTGARVGRGRCTPRLPRRARRSARSSRSERQRLAAGLHRATGGPQQARRLVHRLLPFAPRDPSRPSLHRPRAGAGARCAATSVRIATDSSSSSPGPNQPIAPQ